MQTRITGNRYRNAMIGLAAGDAWGYQVEFTKYKTMPKPVKMPPNVWFVSDDTQMTLALENAVRYLDDHDLIVPGNYSLIEDAIADEFIAWADSPENTRAPGATCMGSIANLNKGQEWWDAAINSAGCGAVMRLLPTIALSDSQWKAMTALQAVMTHKHPMAVASALLLGYTARALVDCGDRDLTDTLLIGAHYMENKKFTKDEFLMSALEPITSDVDAYLAEGVAGDLRAAINQAVAYMEDFTVHNLSADEIMDEDICAGIGEGWDSATAVVLACLAAQCALSGRLTVKQAMEWAVTSNGDSDSIGAITGMLIGLSSDRADFWQVHGIEPKFEAIYEGKIKK